MNNKRTFMYERTCFLSFCLFIFFSLQLQAEEAPEKITLSFSNIPLSEAIKKIESTTIFTFFYDVNKTNLNQPVSLNVKNATIEEAITQLLKSSDLTFSVTNRQIALYLRTVSVEQRKTVTGTVTNEDGEPVIGANVVEKGTTNGITTDADGNFRLDVGKDAVLLISYIGYISQELPVKDQSSVAVSMSEDLQALDEVVVVGYGTQKKVNLTGSVESVKGEVLENRPLRSAVDGLQGTVSGLTVLSGSGSPGESASFEIRGISSVNKAGALVIIDGMPGNLARLNPLDIESISILKDAASAAIYGARAAEGVILVTTKKGGSDKVKIDYSTNISFNTPTRLPQSNHALNHALLSNTAFENAGLTVLFPQYAVDAIKDPATSAIANGNDWIYTSDVDWISMMMDNSFQQTHNLSVSRSTDAINYLFSGNWLDQDGLFAEYGPDHFDMYNFRSNINTDLISRLLNFDSRIAYSHSTKKYHPHFGSWTIPYITFIQAGPNMPVYDLNGNYSRYRMQANPIQALKEGGEGNEKIQRLDGVFTLSLTPVKNLTLKAVGGVTFIHNQKKEWRRAYGKYGPNGLISMAAGQSGPNRITQSAANTRYTTGQFLADYNFKVTQHEVNMLAGWSAELNRYEYLEGMRTDIIGNELPALKLGSTDGWTNTADENEWALLSGFMRLNYAYSSKYLFEFNIRADGSSRFSRKNKWGYFPSASIGWRVTEEKFMQSQKLFSNLKIRASYGELGNQNGLGLYDHVPQYVVSGYYPFSNGLAQWARMMNLPSEDRTWETVSITNLAVDMGFLNNRLGITGEYYIKKNKDMLVNIEIPSVIGIDVPTGNYGELEVKGWDLSVSWQEHVNKDFSYSARFNLSDQKDKLVDYGVEFVGFTAGVNQKIQGYSLGSIFGYKTDGYFTSEEEVANSAVINRSVVGVGDIKYVDQDGDSRISAPNDLKYLGTTTPRFVFGLSLGATWKDFDLSALFQGVGKRNFYLSRHVMAPFQDTWGNYSYTFHNDYWTPENLNALLPRHYAGNGHNTHISDHWLQNAAYIRMKNLQVGYTLPKVWANKILLSRVRVYVSGENLFEYSKLLKDFDPELTTIDGFMYPMLRKYSFGLNVTF
jgi:TonB-linked SusC/RagA family outer membrane protein